MPLPLVPAKEGLGGGVKMRFFRSLCFGLLFLTSNLCASEPIKNPFLYRADGGRSPIYLLGTIHLGVSARELPFYVRMAFERSDILMSEMGPRGFGWAEARMISALFDWTHPWRGLKSRLGPVAWTRLKAISDRKMHYFLNRMEPWFVCLTLGLNLDAFDEGRMDKELAEWGKHKVHRALDSSSELVRDLQSVCTLEDLKSILEDPELERVWAQMQSQARALISAYQEGNEEKIAASEGSGLDERLSQVLLEKRNQTWLPKILAAERSARKSVFVFVGAAHLFGKNGLLELLKTKGYSLSRVISAKDVFQK